MWKHTFVTILGSLLIFPASSKAAGAGSLEVGPNSVLIYKSYSGPVEREWILRLARFGPDVVLEWESFANQGTLHLFRNSVLNGTSFSLFGLFEPGVEKESKKVMTIWFSRKTYGELVSKGRTRIKVNRFPRKLELLEDDRFRLSVNRRPHEVAVIRAEDDRGAEWVLLKDPDNPVLLEYTERKYRLALVSFQTRSQVSLRWLRRLPPVK
ncbi:MAG: hypothetical protein OXT71_18450 [Acidobacteriota bacterium]|nr:hypothetical protein [Acidobacteriota bacterium]